MNYDEALTRLAEAETAHAAGRARVDDWYARQCAAAERAVTQATGQVAGAEQAVAAARRAVTFTDAESARLWQLLATRRRLRSVAALGPPPEPTDETVTEQPARLLERARETLDETRPVPPPRIPWPVAVLVIVTVAVAIAVAVLSAR
jgi:hypothetical protein